jgi:hypothetical protein
MRVSSPVLPLIFMVLLVFFSGQVMAEPAGEVEELSGTVEAQLRDEPSRTLSEGDMIYVGDVITTAGHSHVVVRFRDQTLFELGPRSSFEVNDFTYQQDVEEPSFGARIVRGTFRFVTGPGRQGQAGILQRHGHRGHHRYSRHPCGRRGRRHFGDDYPDGGGGRKRRRYQCLQ